MRNPKFSFLFSLWIIFRFQYSIKAKLIFNETFNLWYHEREFNLIHFFHMICLIMKFFFRHIWLWNIVIGDRIVFFLFDLGIWFSSIRIRFLLFGCYLLFIYHGWDGSPQSISVKLDEKKKIVSVGIRLYYWHSMQTYEWKKWRICNIIRCL